MVLNHLAALFFFSGPLFYIGLALAAFPSTIARLPEDPGRRGTRRALRLAGLALVAGALLLGAAA